MTNCRNEGQENLKESFTGRKSQFTDKPSCLRREHNEARKSGRHTPPALWSPYQEKIFM